ncbi:MAG: hypothetical protein ABWX84_01535 [Nocardioides sp.]
MNADVAGRLAELRSLIEDARAMPMSGSVVVNKHDLFENLEKVERSLAVASTESDRIVTERAQVLAEGESIAIEVVRQAELERDKLVSDSEVFRVAQREADALLTDARSEAAALRADTDRYIEARFSSFEHALDRTLGEVRRGIAHLNAGNGSFVLPTDQPPA